MNANSPLLLSMQVGWPRTIGVEGAADPWDRPWVSAFFKEPVDGPLRLGRLGLAGDGQADMLNHGGPDKAILVYAASHYPLWAQELGLESMPHGGFGENLTVGGQAEGDVCIGDLLAIGPARVQVTQPRQPCWKLARRWRLKDLTARVVANGRCGWYLRVLEGADLEAGLPIEVLERPNPDWTVARAADLYHHRKNDREGHAALADCEGLSDSWREALRDRLAKAPATPSE